MQHSQKDLIEKLYARLPVRLQNLAFAFYGLQLRKQRYGRYFKTYSEWLRKSEWWSEEQIRSYQIQKMQEVVAEAYYHIPYYRDLLTRLGLTVGDFQDLVDLQKLPVLTKETVREQPADFISERFPLGSLIRNLTSGTTGTPLTVYLTHEAFQFQWAVWWRHRARFGLRLGDKFLTFGARLSVPVQQKDPPFWRYNRTVNQVYLSTYHINPANTAAIVDWLNHEDFDFYTGYPSAMYALAAQMEAQGLRLYNRPKYVITGADALLPTFETKIRRIFGVPVSEQYGMAEACGNLAKCENGRFHLDAEFCILELLPIPGLEGTDLRRLVFTGLANPAMPFIRYDTGDYGRIAKGPCPCGRQSPSLISIDGRTEEFIRTPDGRMVTGMNQVFEWAPGVQEVQIVQIALDRIQVKTAPGQNFNKTRDHMILETELRKRIGDEIQIEFDVVEAIPRSKGGKYRAVVSQLEVLTPEERQLRQSVGESPLSVESF